MRSKGRPTTAPKGVTPRGAATPYGAPKPTCPSGQGVLWDHVENMWRCFPTTSCPEGYRWDDYWDAKQSAIECYRSQFIEGWPDDSPTFVDRLRQQAATWGFAINTRYGEPFASREPIGLSSTATLI